MLHCELVVADRQTFQICCLSQNRKCNFEFSVCPTLQILHHRDVQPKIKELYVVLVLTWTTTHKQQITIDFSAVMTSHDGIIIIYRYAQVSVQLTHWVE